MSEAVAENNVAVQVHTLYTYSRAHALRTTIAHFAVCARVNVIFIRAHVRRRRSPCLCAVHRRFSYVRRPFAAGARFSYILPPNRLCRAPLRRRPSETKRARCRPSTDFFFFPRRFPPSSPLRRVVTLTRFLVRRGENMKKKKLKN